jgi:hypothetical protein
MSTYGGTLIKGRGLAEFVWLALLAIVAAVTIWAALTIIGRPADNTRQEPGGGVTTTRVEPGQPYEPIVVNGRVCGQCMP